MANPEQVGTDPQWTVGDRLRKGRELTGLDRGEFAKEIGLSRNTVGKYESGDVMPPKIVLNAWVLRTPVTARWIETGQTEQTGRPDGPGGSAGSRCTEPYAAVSLIPVHSIAA